MGMQQSHKTLKTTHKKESIESLKSFKTPSKNQELL